MYRGNKTYRDVRYREYVSDVPSAPPVFVGLPERYGYSLEFFDESGTMIGRLGSDIKNNPVIRVEFTAEEFGCGEFTMELAQKPVFTIGYKTRVQVRPFFDQGDPWFTGFIKKVPTERVPGDSLIYEGYGYYDQLSWVLINGTWAAVDTGALFGSIVLNQVAPNTDILYSAGKIGNTGFNATELEWDYVTCTDAGDDLSKMSGNYAFGIDAAREGFFRTIVTTAQNHWWEGIHFASASIDLDASNIINRIYVKGGEVDAGGSNIISIRENAASIATYGLREKIVSLPSAMDSADGDEFGDYQLALYKDPRYTGTVNKLNLNMLTTQRPVVVNGAARITMNNGTQYTIQVRRVRYTISSEGIWADVEVGDLDAPVEGPFLELIRKIETEARINDLRTTQLV